MNHNQHASSEQGADRVVREYEFGQFRLILQPHNAVEPARILKGGREVAEFKKSRRACLLLIYLIERCEKSIPAADLMIRLWPGKQAEQLRDPKRSLTDIIQNVRCALDKDNPYAYIGRADSEVQFVYRPVKICYEEENSKPQDEVQETEPLLYPRPSSNTQSDTLKVKLDMAERTYFKYRGGDIPLMDSPELIELLARRYNCEPLQAGGRTFAATILWKNEDRVVPPDSILGDFDDAPPSRLRESATLSPSEYPEARDFIKKKFEEGPIKNGLCARIRLND